MFDHGSEIIIADFHLHTRKDKEFSYDGLENSFVSDYVDALASKRINVGVITNHNKFDYDEYKALRSAAKKKDIFILPGTELSIKEGSNGVHTLIIFNPDDWFQNGHDSINEFLNSVFLNIPNRENANTRCNYDLIGTLATLDAFNKDYFIIFAHIENNSGFYKECGGGLIQTLSNKPEFKKRVLGMQKVRTRNVISNLLSWTGKEYALVEGSDPKSLDDIGKTGSATYIKIGEYSFEAIKYALADHKNRLFSMISTPKRSFIKSISFVGGKFDGQTLKLSNQLNTLIGARGSGKSAIIEAIRYCLCIEPSSDPEYKSGLVKHILGSGGQISMLVVDEHGNEYEIRRILNEQPSVIDSSGKDLSIATRSVLRNPLYFGQKDLAQSNPGYELKLLDKLVGNRITSREAILTELETALSNNIERLITLSQIPAKMTELEQQERELCHKLKIYEEKGVSARLDKQTSCNKDAVKIDSLHNELKTIISAYHNFLMSCSTAAITLVGYTSKYNDDIFARVQTIVDLINSRISQISDIVTALEQDSNDLNQIQQELNMNIQALKDEFAKIKREINDDSLDLDSFEKYQKERASVIEQIAKHKLELVSKETIISEIKTIIRNRNEQLKAIFDEYLKETTKINESQSELQINILFKGDKNCLDQQLRSALKGSGLNDAKYKSLCEDFTDIVGILEDYFINNGKKLKNLKTPLTEREYENIVKKLTSDYSALIKLRCPNQVEITYHGKPLSKQSAGQRASALILFILSQEENDVFIIDQPEDDLDNQVVYTEFIRTLCAKKSNAQFIFATHNANIPVLGDAEKIIATEYSDKKITVALGNIDSKIAQQKIIDIMEGGYEAFNRRNQIYKLWLH